ncbi:hypothetical protein CEXT_804381 [Caerostris extrusa]|uniref:Uncharacterized protein n=1 Tax=Caerostris extrusa TaxID=172846 RepID=A0AAV4THP5_CAEEX|nr:hypothetical protein CEXT_804381 [Caerostris extrusa]
MFVGSFFVLAMDDHEVVNGFDVDVLGSEVLHVEHHLDFVGIRFPRRNGDLRSWTDDKVRSGRDSAGQDVVAGCHCKGRAVKFLAKWLGLPVRQGFQFVLAVLAEK